ncbi:DUF2500 domain-containing protein [Anoxybacterium hadale]|uniref:DUF2500 domain-containing protein n=1 Tax=Anoxybacterium hadale TaxID=3408580 RepID=A0ACD1AFJ7_9FIRM|nr:DUF2500 domain-containing protein [Clostridiales bacterium]
MGYSSFGGFDGIMFSIMPLFMAVIFFIVIGMIILTAVRGAKEWKSNNESPVLTVEAVIVTKRVDVHHFHNDAGPDNIGHTSTSTTYYATFEVPSGDRMEFRVGSREYGMLVEGDAGKLTFQGTRYQGFERIKD